MEASCQLRVGFYLYFASCKLQVASCELRVASCELRVASWFSIISIHSILLFQFYILAKFSYDFLNVFLLLLKERVAFGFNILVHCFFYDAARC